MGVAAKARTGVRVCEYVEVDVVVGMLVGFEFVMIRCCCCCGTGCHETVEGVVVVVVIIVVEGARTESF